MCMYVCTRTAEEQCMHADAVFPFKKVRQDGWCVSGHTNEHHQIYNGWYSGIMMAVSSMVDALIS